MLKIVLCGDAAVGKTSLLTKYMGEGYQHRNLKTIGADFALKKNFFTDSSGITQANLFQLWDIAGQQNFRSVPPFFFRGINGAILIFDISRLSTFENIFHWVAEIARENEKKIIPLILIANKIDLRKESDITITTEKGQKLAEEISLKFFDGSIKIPYIETSAKTGENVEEAFTKIADLTNRTLDLS